MQIISLEINKNKEDEMDFNYDKKTIIVTFIIFILMLFGVIKLFQLFEISRGFWKYFSLFFLLFIIFALILSYLLLPKRVILDDRLIIDRVLSKIYIDYKNIKEVNILDSNDVINKSTKVFGNSGLFGYYGKFRSDKFGKYFLYAKRISGKYVLIKTNNNSYIIAPSKPEIFIEKLKEKCKL